MEIGTMPIRTNLDPIIWSNVREELLSYPKETLVEHIMNEMSDEHVEKYLWISAPLLNLGG
jgi:predicted nucleic acid-binding OB-fold protein